MIVDLPDPVEPTRKTNSPGWTANVASSSPRSPLGYFFVTERKSTTAPGTGSPTTRWRGGLGSVRRLMWRSVAAMSGPGGYSPRRLAPLPARRIAPSQYRLWHGEDPLLHPPQRAAAVPGRLARDPGGDRPGGLRGRRADRARGGERHGALPRAPRVQGWREVLRLPQGQRDRRADGRHAQRLHVARSRRLPHHHARRGGRRRDRPADRLRRPAEA